MLLLPLPMPSQTTVPAGQTGVPQVNPSGNNPPVASINPEQFVNQMWNVMSGVPESVSDKVVVSMLDRLRRTNRLNPDILRRLFPDLFNVSVTQTPQTQMPPSQPAQTANVPQAETPQQDAVAPPAGGKKMFAKTEPYFQQIMANTWNITDPNDLRDYLTNNVNLLVQGGELNQDEANFLMQRLNASLQPKLKEQKPEKEGLSGNELMLIMFLSSFLPSLFQKR